MGLREILAFRLSQVVDTVSMDHVVPENVKMPGSSTAMVETNEPCGWLKLKGVEEK